MDDVNKNTRIFHIVLVISSLFSANVIGSIVVHYCKIYFGFLKNNNNILKEFVFRTIFGYIVLFFAVFIVMVIAAIISGILNRGKNPEI